MKDNYKYRDYFNNIAPKRRSHRKKWSYYWDEITDYCDYFIHRKNSVLEIGCGTGELLARVKGKRKVGIDFSPVMIEEAKKAFPGIEFKVMNAENLEFEETFDVIILSNLIGYVNDVQQVFEELTKVCHPKTKIIATYYNYLWQPMLNIAEFFGLKSKAPSQNWLSQSDINNLLYLAGFDVYRTTRRMLIPVNIPLVSFLANRYLSKLPGFRYFSINIYCFARQRQMIKTSEAGNRYSVSVVIPAMNECGNIEAAILRMPEFGKWLELIFIEGGSRDSTWEKILEMEAKYKDKFRIKTAQQNGKGKGDAVRKGFEMAEGDILMILDADLTVPPEDLPKFYNALACGKGEFINGSRLVYAMEKHSMKFLNELGNLFFGKMFTWLLDQKFNDTLCGTKTLFRSDYELIKANREFFGDFDPFGDFDLIFGAHKLNLHITELPIRYQERTYGSTNISRIKHGFLLLKMCIFAARKIKFR